MRVTTMAVLALHAASPHRVDQVGEDPLWKSLPLSLQHLEQMLGIPGRGVVAPDFAIQLIPEVLNRVEIGTACWPLHSVDARLLQEVDHPCPVGASVVILVDSHRSYLLQCRHSQRSKDLVLVSEAIQVTLYMIQGCSVVKAEGPQIITEPPPKATFSWTVVSIKRCPGRLQTLSRPSLWFMVKRDSSLRRTWNHS